MAEIDILSNRVESLKIVKDQASFSKKNAWKNEWEKAQLKTDNHAGQSVESKQKNISNQKQHSKNYLNAEYNDVLSEDYKKIEKSYASDSSHGSDVSNNNYVANASEVNRHISTLSNESALSVNSDSLMKKSNESLLSIKKNQLTNKFEQDLREQFKLQNLSIVRQGEKFKVYIRDYRADKSYLEKTGKWLMGHLNELGYDVDSIVINGELYK